MSLNCEDFFKFLKVLFNTSTTVNRMTPTKLANKLNCTNHATATDFCIYTV